MADASVGSGKVVTTTGLTLVDGTGKATNYTLTGGNHTVNLTAVAVVSTPPAVSYSHGGQFATTKQSISFVSPTVPPVTTTPSVIPSIPSSSTTFTISRSAGSTGSDIKSLQIYLNTHGYVIAKTGAGSIGHETNYFGPATKTALIKFQKANGITPAVGYFGPVTREYVNTH
jgi:hypothetical protein